METNTGTRCLGIAKLVQARKIAGSVVAAVLVVAGIVALTGCRAQPERTVLFFYEVACPSCEESQRMEALAGEIVRLGRADRRIAAAAHDVFHGDGLEVYRDAVSRLGEEVPPEAFPVMIVDGRDLYQGEEAIVAELEDLREKAGQ